MNITPLISVIITFYNTPEQFFREAIESVFAQTFQNWELFLVDDGSDATCTSVAEQYVSDHPSKVFYLEHDSHKNKGISASRNLGINHVKGEFITFLDSDDVWLPSKLEQQLSIIKSQPKAGMIYGRSNYWYSWTGNSEDRLRDRIQEHGIQADKLIRPPQLLELFLQGKALIPCPSSILVLTNLLKKIGGFEVADDEIDISQAVNKLNGKTAITSIINNLYEDQIFYAKVCLEHPVFISNLCWDKYRQHPNSVCAVSKTDDSKIARMVYIEWLESYLSKKDLKGSKIWRALKVEKMLHRHWRIGRPFKRTLRFVGRIKGTYPLCIKKID
jgi:glycosyltransferase involved in cell wall biosynthesis